MNALEVAVTEAFGERCPDYDADCPCCIAWEAFDKSECQSKLIDELVEAIENGAQVNTPDLMEWVAERLIHVHGENPHVDYVLSLRTRAEKLRLASSKAQSHQTHKPNEGQ